MKKWTDKLRSGFMQFMEGRYGTDELGMFLFGASLLLYFLGLFFGQGLLVTLSSLLMGYILFRSFSKNIWKRRQENEKYKQLLLRIKRLGNLIKLSWRDRKSYRYYLCPKCGQIVRLPKLNRRVEIKCPKCGNQFVKKA